ncbi:uncharacterized protein METZ01_LOCUS47886 [marine metagenome]|uniref:Uncharacterized protein n=1 Tax=marine metagenome TaxID=408172 RepID=A0A381RT37_9ZZZZ
MIILFSIEAVGLQYIIYLHYGFVLISRIIRDRRVSLSVI